MAGLRGLPSFGHSHRGYCTIVRYASDAFKHAPRAHVQMVARSRRRRRGGPPHHDRVMGSRRLGVLPSPQRHRRRPLRGVLQCWARRSPGVHLLCPALLRPVQGGRRHHPRSADAAAIQGEYSDGTLPRSRRFCPLTALASQYFKYQPRLAVITDAISSEEGGKSDAQVFMHQPAKRRAQWVSATACRSGFSSACSFACLARGATSCSARRPRRGTLLHSASRPLSAL